MESANSEFAFNGMNKLCIMALVIYCVTNTHVGHFRIEKSESQFWWQEIVSKKELKMHQSQQQLKYKKTIIGLWVA